MIRFKNRNTTRLASRLTLVTMALSLVVLLPQITFGQENGGAGQGGKQDAAVKKTVPTPPPSGCPTKMSEEVFVVDATGNASDSGKSFEGPVCIVVFYDPLNYLVTFSTKTTTTNGPDLGSVFLGGSQKQGGEGVASSRADMKSFDAMTLPQAFVKVLNEFGSLKNDLGNIGDGFTSGVQQEQVAIDGLKRLVSQSANRNAPDLPEFVKRGYPTIQTPLKNALQVESDFTPSDLVGSAPGYKVVSGTDLSLLTAIRKTRDALVQFPIKFADGKPVSDASQIQCQSSDSTAVAWKDWYAKCKDAYDGLKQQLDTAEQQALTYTSTSDNIKNLKSLIAITKSWDANFIQIGLKTSMSPKQVADANIDASFVASKPVSCGTLFNKTSNTAVSLVVFDQTAIFDGKPPTSKTQDSFASVSCSTPFTVSGGVGFSLIRQQEFAIVKSTGGANNTSVSKFGTLGDSKVHPMPLAMAHVRLADFWDHKSAFHVSVGVAGNIQGQDNGGSSAEFLLGGSWSFWRTMYLSAGLQIGTKTQLAGGFKVGDPVPSDVTAVQVQKSYAPGFGFAITFTKP